MGRKSRLKKERDENRDRKNRDSDRFSLEKRSLSLFLPLLAVIFAAGVLLRLYNLAGVSARSPDENVHTFQANIILQEGPVKGVRKLVESYNSDKEQWLYPKPIRIGYIWPTAALMKVLNRKDPAAGAYASCIFSICSLAVLSIFGLRFFNKWIALYAVTFMSVSPIPLAIARRTWSDAMLGCLGLLLIYLSCEIIRTKDKLIWYLLFAIVGSYSVTVKESGAIMYAFCIAWLLWVLCVKGKTYTKGIILVAISCVGVGISVLLTLYSSGGIPAVLETMRHFNEAIPTNTYSIEYMSGPWIHFIGAFWIISFVNASLWVLGAAVVFLQRDVKNRGINSGIIFLTGGLILITLLAPNVQNMRYLSPIFGVFYLIGGVGLWHILMYVKKKLSNFYFSIAVSCIGIILIVAAVGDYQTYKKIFVKTGIVDTSINLIRKYAR